MLMTVVKTLVSGCQNLGCSIETALKSITFSEQREISAMLCVTKNTTKRLQITWKKRKQIGGFETPATKKGCHSVDHAVPHCLVSS